MMTEEVAKQEESLRVAIEKLLPDFVKSCRENVGPLILHQDSFAVDYQDHEYSLLGMAIKFAGLHGKEVRIIGKNRETLMGAIKHGLLQ